MPNAPAPRSCPEGFIESEVRSNKAIGTAVHFWLGYRYVMQFRPKPYCVTDLLVWWHSSSNPDDAPFFWALRHADPLVAAAFEKHEFWRYFTRRPDILDAERNLIFEIKPADDPSEGPRQLAEYIWSLNKIAGRTSPEGTSSPLFGPSRERKWDAGDWPPQPIDSPRLWFGGTFCRIRAWADPDVRGLILYKIICCGRESEDPASATVGLAATRVTAVSRELSRMQPQLAQLVARAVPAAPAGMQFAILATPRFFHTFVLGPRDRQMMRRLGGGRPLDPLHVQRVLALWMAAHFTPLGPLADVAMVDTGLMDWDEMKRIWGIQLLVGLAVSVVAALVIAAPEVALPALEAAAEEGAVEEATAVVAREVAKKAAAETLLAEEAAVAAEEAAAAAERAREAAQALEQARERWLMMEQAARDAAERTLAEAAEANSLVEPWMTAASRASSAESGLTHGVALLGASVTWGVPAGADPNAPPDPQHGAVILGVDPFVLQTTEILGGDVRLDGRVFYAGQRYFMIGLVTAGTQG